MSATKDAWERFYERQAESNDENAASGEATTPRDRETTSRGMREAIRRAEDENEENVSHECLACGYRCHISTPQIKARNWCQGNCDRFSTFKRIDKIDS